MSNYPFLSLAVIRAYLPLIREKGVSEVARSPRGFLTAYAQAGSSARLSEKWLARREAFLARHLAQARMANEPWWTLDGKPTRRHLALMAWAYTPTPLKTSKRAGL